MQSIVECCWSDTFAIVLEQARSEFSTEVIVQVVIPKNKGMGAAHTVSLDAPVTLLQMHGFLYVCYYLANGSDREVQGTPNTLTVLMQGKRQFVLPPLCPSSSTGQFRSDQTLRNDIIGDLHEQKVGWNFSVVSTSGEQLVKVLTAAYGT